MSPETANSLSSANLERRDALDRLILLIEQQLPGVRASVLVLDDDGVTLHHGGAPNLPEEYCALIDGLKIGPKAGSCGTAVFRGKAVIVEDIANDPLWENYRDFALPHGLRACWSTPICDDENRIIGSFAMYYAVPRLPTPPERSMTKTATLLASNIIVHARSQAQLIDRASRLDQKSQELAASEARARAVRAEADHAVESARAFAKLEADKMTYDLESVRTVELIRPVELLIAPALSDRNISYTRGECDSHLELRCDPKKTSLILFNLFSKAAKLTPEQGRIALTATRLTPKSGCIKVSASGITESVAEIATAFEDESNALGMLVSRRLARGMGGDITLEKRPDGVIEFILELPAP
jgi:GAF domain-containing protein